MRCMHWHLSRPPAAWHLLCFPSIHPHRAVTHMRHPNRTPWLAELVVNAVCVAAAGGLGGLLGGPPFGLALALIAGACALLGTRCVTTGLLATAAGIIAASLTSA